MFLYVFINFDILFSETKRAERTEKTREEEEKTARNSSGVFIFHALSYPELPLFRFFFSICVFFSIFAKIITKKKSKMCPKRMLP